MQLCELEVMWRRRSGLHGLPAAFASQNHRQAGHMCCAHVLSTCAEYCWVLILEYILQSSVTSVDIAISLATFCLFQVVKLHPGAESSTPRFRGSESRACPADLGCGDL